MFIRVVSFYSDFATLLCVKKFLLTLLLALPLFGQSTPTTLYRTLQIDGDNYQAILTRPDSPGKHPAVFLIGGLGCYSLDNLKPDDPFSQLLSGLTQRGYVTMRVEKNGEGKSQGPPCDSPESDLQLGRSLAGLNALADPNGPVASFVDRDNIFILAHSIRSLKGVLVAQKFPVRGIIAAETIGRNWIEYQTENACRQFQILAIPYDETDHAVRTMQRCQHRFFVDKQTPEQILKAWPECKESVNTFGVSYTYLQQVADLDLAVEWKKLDLPVLVTYGTSDPATSADESHYLVL